MIGISVDANFDEVYQALLKYKEEIDRKLVNMVKGFSYQVVLTAVENTPYGSLDRYGDLYELRETDPDWQSYGLQPIPGFARGSWQANTTGSFALQENYGESSGIAAANSIKPSLVSYKLGQDVYIGNAGFYIGDLEAGSSKQAPDGIKAPTEQHIMNVLQADLVRLFNEG